MNNRFIEATEENAIRNLQRYLKQLSYFYPSLVNDIIITGVYDSNTRTAVRNLQKQFDIKADGIVNKATWDMIFSCYLQSINENSSHNCISFFNDKPSTFEIKPGDSSAIVRIVEVILDEISTVYTDFENTVTHNGIYDETKVNAIRIFQEINLLEITGSINSDTWNSLANEYNAISRANSIE
jgi:peptidoglycan hydrolase-like protein with peptidoglycan-binding domain